MHRIAKFHFVSPAQFMTAMQEEYPQYTEEQIKEMYEALKLPKRATKEAPDMISLPRLLLN